MLTKKQIRFLNHVCEGPWKQVSNLINVENDVNMESMNLTQIPVQFGEIDGNFICSCNNLTNLIGAPNIIHGSFDCSENKLTTLINGPIEVRDCYMCEHNQLTNLIGAPTTCNEDFWCRANKLTSLEGIPTIDNGCMLNYNLTLKYLFGIRQVEGTVFYDKNEINEWIIACMKKGIIFPHFTLEENINWIKTTGLYSCLFTAPKEIHQYFSKYIINSAKNMLC